MDRELLAVQSGGKLMPELCSLLENDSNEGTPPDFDACFGKEAVKTFFYKCSNSGKMNPLHS